MHKNWNADDADIAAGIPNVGKHPERSSGLFRCAVEGCLRWRLPLEFLDIADSADRLRSCPRLPRRLRRPRPIFGLDQDAAVNEYERFNEARRASGCDSFIRCRIR
jgi:hypothetical protein